MGGDVKAQSSPAHVVADGRTSGVRFLSRERSVVCAVVDATIDEGVDRRERRSRVRVIRSVRNLFDLEAVLFSRESGNHPAIRASMGQGFVRLSGGA